MSVETIGPQHKVPFILHALGILGDDIAKEEMSSAELSMLCEIYVALGKVIDAKMKTRIAELESLTA